LEKKVWYLEEVDLYNILCPYKMANHLNSHPYDHFRQGDFIFLPDEIARDIYLVAEGKVKIGYYDEEGNEYVKAYLHKGDLLGEISYLGQGKHKDFAQCMKDDTRICRMSAEKARELSRSYVPFALEIHQKIADNVLRLERKLEILFYKDIRKRLIELLKDLHQMYSDPSEPCEWIFHDLTQEEMASLIGTSRKTVSVFLNTFERDGVIELGSGKFRLQQEGNLLKAS